MALQVRRGTNAERLGITPLAGELVYTTDTKQLYVGDGATAGGITSIAGTIDSLLADTTPQLGGTLDLNSNDITGIGNINITGTITATGNINLGDGAGSDIISVGGSLSGHLLPSDDITWNLGSLTYQFKEAWISQLNVENQITADRINATLIADDSTVVFDASTGLLAASQLTGIATIDINGSIFSDDSSIIVDGIDGSISTNVIKSSNLEIKTDVIADRIGLDIVTVDQTSTFRLLRKSDSNISAAAIQYGRLVFGRSDIVGLVETCSISGYQDGFAISHDTSGLHTSPSENFFIKDGVFAFGTFAPATNAKVDVAGNLHVTGGYTQFGSLDTSQRNALTPANGMVIYNTTNNKFEGYQNSAWINLDDGLAAS